MNYKRNIMAADMKKIKKGVDFVEKSCIIKNKFFIKGGFLWILQKVV